MVENKNSSENFDVFLKEQEEELAKLKAFTSQYKDNHVDQSQFSASPLAKYNHRITEYEEIGALKKEEDKSLKAFLNSKRIKAILWVVFALIIMVALFMLFRGSSKKNKDNGK